MSDRTDPARPDRDDPTAVARQTSPHLIEHPEWCVHVPDDAPYISDGHYTRLAPREVEQEHATRDYRLDVGELFGCSLIVKHVQSYGLGAHDTDPVDHSPVRVRLELIHHEAPELPQADMTPSELDTLIRLLQLAVHETRLLVGVVDAPAGGRRG